MKKIDLSKFSLSDLIKLQNDIPKAIEKVKKTEKKVIRKQIEELAAESGFNLDELFDNKKKPQKKRGKVKPKYENPDNTDQTWTGRGRMPLWVQDHLASGGEKDDLLI